MKQMFSLSYLQSMAVRRLMDWDLIKSLSGVSLGKIGNNIVYPASHGREMTGLQPGLVRVEYLTRETPQQAATFLNWFLDVKG